MSVATRARMSLRAVNSTMSVRASPAPLQFDAAWELEATRDAAKAEERKQKEQVVFGDPKWKQPLQKQLTKSFAIHLGADLRVPIVQKDVQHISPTPSTEETTTSADPFEGLPFARLADRLGGRIAPIYQEFKKHDEAAKKDQKLSAEVAQPWEPTIPHFLPVTKIATSNPHFKKAFIFDPKERKTARLSWYHPDDTMVPRDWFTGGLVADLRYYFGKN